jgi:hypothetical protein
MKHKIYIFLFTLVLMLSLGGLKFVCACPLYSSTPSVCEMYGKSGAIFVGKIVDIKEKKNEKSPEFDEIYFETKEVFLGVKKNIRLKVNFTSGLIDYCGFEIGKIYLVYAFKDSKNNLNSDGMTRIYRSVFYFYRK